MYGNAGNDKLTDDGGSGFLYGGKGNDILKGYDRQGRYLELHGGRGTDTLKVRGHLGSYVSLSGNDDYTARDGSRRAADLARYAAFDEEVFWLL